MYAKFFKRCFDFILALGALLCLSPLLLALIVIGWYKMKGNPFFTQERPGLNEKIFKLIKFRSMTCETDSNGNLLPDEQRVTRYGNFIRATSLDELPELLNILKGDMSIIGPRPLLVKYLPYYSEAERLRHSVRPGMTGLAQVHGRNALNWEGKFAYDVEYARNITLFGDVKIVIATILTVLKHEHVELNVLEDFDVYRQKANFNKQ